MWNGKATLSRKQKPILTTQKGSVRSQTSLLLLFANVPGTGLTEAQERKALAEEEESRIARGDFSLHTTSASAFVFLALELEDIQYVILII